MIITSTNNYPNASSSFVVSSDAQAGQLVADMETGDFSTGYTSAGSSATFTVDKVFSASFNCKYVALAGHNFASVTGTCVVELVVNSVSKGSVNFTPGEPNYCAMWNFDDVVCTSMSIVVTKSVSTDRLTLKYISAGDTFSSVFQYSANDQMGGFPIHWRTPSKKVRSILNESAQPVAYVRESIGRKTQLNLPNLARVGSIQTTNWLDLMQRISIGGDFFIKDQDGTVTGTDEKRSTTMCFDATAQLKTNPNTRNLQDLSLSFTAYTGQ
jgi:hypothetical protein